MTIGASEESESRRLVVVEPFEELRGRIKQTVRALEPDAELILYGSRARAASSRQVPLVSLQRVVRRRLNLNLLYQALF